MVPATPPGANIVYSKPADWDEATQGPCEDLAVIKKDGFISSIWKPDEAELAALNNGGYVLLVIASNELPPVSIGTVGPTFVDGAEQMAASEDVAEDNALDN